MQKRMPRKARASDYKSFHQLIQRALHADARLVEHVRVLVKASRLLRCSARAVVRQWVLFVNNALAGLPGNAFRYHF